jgi:predicted amidophosphoribosyltransferase
VGFLDPKNQDDEDDALPGASGLHLDLDLKRCPRCRREVDPWRAECPDCGEVAVHAGEVPGSSFPLPPGLRGDDDEVE